MFMREGALLKLRNNGARLLRVIRACIMTITLHPQLLLTEKITQSCQAWCSIPAVPFIRRLKQKGGKFKATKGYRLSPQAV